MLTALKREMDSRFFLKLGKPAIDAFRDVYIARCSDPAAGHFARAASKDKELILFQSRLFLKFRQHRTPRLLDLIH